MENKIQNFSAINGVTFITNLGDNNIDGDLGKEFKIPCSSHFITDVINNLKILLSEGITTQEQINDFMNGISPIFEYYQDDTNASMFNEYYLLQKPCIVSYLLQGVENDLGKAISLDDNTSFEFTEDNNLTINIDNSVSDTSPIEAIKNLDGVLKIDQINSIKTKVTDSISSYKVQSGDTLSAIAESKNISLSELLQIRK
ncbi:MAG: LysM peptidoglycan-binding domain-containing protein [Deltaproteobacteria bacterium]|nr:LysM peptidoglycan-binding domain-containing protein [Deltaproteobacteria bacterium]